MNILQINGKRTTNKSTKYPVGVSISNNHKYYDCAADNDSYKQWRFLGAWEGFFIHNNFKKFLKGFGLFNKTPKLHHIQQLIIINSMEPAQTGILSDNRTQIIRSVGTDSIFLTAKKALIIWYLVAFIRIF